MSNANSSKVELVACHVDRRGKIKLQATAAFLEVLRTKLGAPRGSTLRVGQFDICCLRKNHYEGVPDENGEEALLEAELLVKSIQRIYSEACLFEAVFAEKGSYESWMIFNRRSPTLRDLEAIAIKRGMLLPEQAAIVVEPVAQTRQRRIKINLRPQIEREAAKTTRVVMDKPIVLNARPKLRLQSAQASPEKLQSLAAAFSRPRQMRVR